ncbi:hypothetical protein ACFL3Q_17455, partial [Planctomycetota bacterium]
CDVLESQRWKKAHFAQVAHNGKIYSDQCSCKELRQLRRRIYKEFYSARQLLKLLRKGIANGALRLLPGVFLRLPKVIKMQLGRRGKHSVKAPKRAKSS